MGKLKKELIIIIFLLLVGAFFIFYQEKSIALAPQTITPPPSTYISFSEGLSNPPMTLVKYAVVDDASNIQINTIYTETALGYSATPAKMAKDSRQKHFVFLKQGLIDWNNNRVLYKTENNLASPPEVVPFPYGSGYGFNFNGFLSSVPDIALDSGNIPYVVTMGRIYSQGQIVNSQIMISKRLSTGWTQAVTLFQLPAVSPAGQLKFGFDQSSNGHLFYDAFTNPSCLAINCPRAIYELVFSPTTLGIISNTLIIPINGPFPEVFYIKASDSYNNIGFVKLTDTSQSPRNLYVDFSSSNNGWISQTLATSISPPYQTHATSLDLELESSINGKINFVASEKNTQTGLAKLLLFTSLNNGASWSPTTLLSSAISQYRDVNLGSRGTELNIGYTKVNNFNSITFSEVDLMRRSNTGSIKNIIVHQSQQGNIMLGDLII